MTPKKAIIIILVLFSIVAIAFFVLYINKKQITEPSDQNIIQKNQAERSASSTEAKEQKLKQIIEETEKDSTLDTPTKKMNNIMDTYNAEMQKQQENIPPEQIEAAAKEQQEIQSAIDKFNEENRQRR